MDLSIVIPAYNEEDNLHNLFNRLNSVISQMELHYEFIFVNDGSKDRSLDIIRDFSKKYPFVKYIDFSRNFGHQLAVTAGLEHATGDAVVIIDADLQDPPELIRDMNRKMQEGYDVVYAKRRKRAGESFMKKFTARMFYRIIRAITNVEIPLDTGDFRIISKRINDNLRRMPEQEKFIRGQISWLGFRQTYIEYDRDERSAGETGYTYRKMIRFALDGITSFSTLPLKLATLSGFLISGLAFLLILYALYSRFITGNFVSGWTSIVISVLFLGGVQLLTIGIIGEYISRMSTNLRNRPLYIISETNIAGEVSKQDIREESDTLI